MDSLISQHVESPFVDEARISRLVNHVAAHMQLPEFAEVSISFVDEDEIHELNLEYRGIDSPTDVLSFECDGLDDDFPSAPEDALMLGDIMISPSVAARQAPEHDSNPVDEVDLLMVHGMLHLCGYDHIADDEAEEMEALQNSILAAWRASEGEFAAEAEAVEEVASDPSEPDGRCCDRACACSGHDVR